MLLQAKNLTIVLAALGTLAASSWCSKAQADVEINGLIWSSPIVVRGSNALSRAYSIAAQKGGRLPSSYELRTASTTLRRYGEFNRPFHVCFTNTPGLQWSIANNRGHNDGGNYYGFDMVIVVRPAWGHGGGHGDDHDDHRRGGGHIGGHGDHDHGGHRPMPAAREQRFSTGGWYWQ